MMKGNQSKNAKKSTLTLLHVFNEWRLTRKKQRALKDIPVGLLDAAHSNFYAEVRKNIINM